MTQSDTLFDQEVDDSPEVNESINYIDSLVGPGKRYKDLETLAKSRIHADQHINDLEDEAKNNREHRAILEGILSELRKKPEEVEPTTNRTQVPTMDIEKTVEQALDKKESERMTQRNKDECIERLTNQFGSREQAVRELKAFAQLYPNMKVHFDYLGSNDPDAFVRLFNSYAKPGAAGEISTPGATGRPSADAIASVSKDLTWSEAKQVKKESPGLYHSREFQEKLVQTVAKYQERGKDFFKT